MGRFTTIHKKKGWVYIHSKKFGTNGDIKETLIYEEEDINGYVHCNEKIAPEKALGTTKPRVNDDVLKLGGFLDRHLSHDKTHLTISVLGSVVAFKLCKWDSGENIIAKVKVYVMSSINLCVQQFALFQTS